MDTELVNQALLTHYENLRAELVVILCKHYPERFGHDDDQLPNHRIDEFLRTTDKLFRTDFYKDKSSLLRFQLTLPEKLNALQFYSHFIGQSEMFESAIDEENDISSDRGESENNDSEQTAENGKRKSDEALSVDDKLLKLQEYTDNKLDKILQDIGVASAQSQGQNFLSDKTMSEVLKLMERHVLLFWIIGICFSLYLIGFDFTDLVKSLFTCLFRFVGM